MHRAEGERTGERLIKFGRRSLCLRWAVGARKTPTLGAGELRGTSLARRGRRRGAPAPSRTLIGWRAGPYLLREDCRIISPSSAPLAEAARGRGVRGRPALFCSCFLRWAGRGEQRGRKLSKEVTIAASSTASRKPSLARQRPPAPVLIAQTE